MGERSTVRDTIVGTVVGGIILAVLGWLVAPDKVAALWTFVWTFLQSTRALPVWALLAAILVVLFMAYVVRLTLLEAVDRVDLARKGAEEQQSIARGLQQVLDRERAAKVPAAPPAPLNADERLVFETLIQADGTRITIDELAAHLNVKRLVVTHGMDGLYERGLVEDTHSAGLGRRFTLSAGGRAKAAKEGLLK